MHVWGQCVCGGRGRSKEHWKKLNKMLVTQESG